MGKRRDFYRQVKRIKHRKTKELYEERVRRVAERIFAHSPDDDTLINMIDLFRGSKSTLEDYVTIDYIHKKDIENLISDIGKYQEDFSKRRPLNYLMYASPGSGKSHFVKCLARSAKLKGFCEEVTYNMTNFQGTDDLINPLEAARNIKVNDKLPILFLDEMDGDNDNFSYVLPLLWDGEMLVGGRDIKLGKIVIIMAISDTEMMKGGVSPNKQIKKLNDFLSRINGGFITIPSLDIVKGERNRQADKICIALSLLERRYGGLLKKAPWNILYLIGLTEFRYGVRSIAYLIDQFPDLEHDLELMKPSRCLSFLSSRPSLKKTGFQYHIEEDEIDNAIERWNKVKDNGTVVNFLEELEEEEE